jgi:hypothetical protein
MVTRNDIIRQAERRYGAYLIAVVTGAPFFPLPLTLGKSRRASEYDNRRAELAELRAAATELGFEVTWTEVADARFGPHERPHAAAFTDEARYLSAIGKTQEAARFRADVELIHQTYPRLTEWLASNTQRIVQSHGQWPRLLRVVQWMLANPISGLYLRQLPIAGVHTKFMEQNQPLIDDLLCTLDLRRSEPVGSSFKVRHGLREEESTLRLRFLDARVRERCRFPESATDIALPIREAAALPLAGTRVFITENFRNFLALPDAANALAIYGQGDAATRLRALSWLADCAIHYWGDIDARGFAILARLRSVFSHTTSLLMDEETLLQHKDFAVTDSSASSFVERTNLTLNERRALDACSAECLRLEQERIPMPLVNRCVSGLEHPSFAQR